MNLITDEEYNEVLAQMEAELPHINAAIDAAVAQLPEMTAELDALVQKMSSDLRADDDAFAQRVYARYAKLSPKAVLERAISLEGYVEGLTGKPAPDFE